MRVVTYNVAGGRPGVRDLDGVASALRGLRPQVVACQEWLEPGGSEAAVRRVDRLARALGLHVVFAGNFASPRGLLGNAILSASAIERYENLDISLPRCEPRGILRVRLENGLELFNAHLGLRPGERRQQWRRLLTATAGGTGSTIVCGDFNDMSGRIDRQARAAGFETAAAGCAPRRRRTFPSRWPLMAIDRVYFRGVGLAAATVLRGPPWTRLSDHLPLIADFHELTGSSGSEPS